MSYDAGERAEEREVLERGDALEVAPVHGRVEALERRGRAERGRDLGRGNVAST